MLAIPFAASFLAGAILTLVVPAGLLVAVAMWHMRAILRVEHGAGTSLDDGPAPTPAALEGPAAAEGPDAAGAQTPATPPPGAR